jgi:ABC-type phosphate/phosphonate transport system substrate-binding protein
VTPDAVSWILPALAMRAAGLNPATDLKGVKLFTDTASMVQAVADGKCAGAGIPSGSLSTFSPTLLPGTSLTVLQTTPELPFGALVIGSNVPTRVSDDVITALANPPDTLLALVHADSLASASSSDYAEFERLAEAAHLNLNTLGQ